MLESKKKEEKKDLKETWRGEDIIRDLVDRAKSYVDDGHSIDDAIAHAIDDGLFYTADVFDLAEHYGVIDDGELIEKFYEDLYNDIYNEVLEESLDESKKCKENKEDKKCEDGKCDDKEHCDE